jgi:hypothetical protein
VTNLLHDVGGVLALRDQPRREGPPERVRGRFDRFISSWLVTCGDRDSAGALGTSIMLMQRNPGVAVRARRSGGLPVALRQLSAAPGRQSSRSAPDASTSTVRTRPSLVARAIDHR